MAKKWGAKKSFGGVTFFNKMKNQPHFRFICKKSSPHPTSGVLKLSKNFFSHHLSDYHLSCYQPCFLFFFFSSELECTENFCKQFAAVAESKVIVRQSGWHPDNNCPVLMSRLSGPKSHRLFASQKFLLS